MAGQGRTNRGRLALPQHGTATRRRLIKLGQTVLLLAVALSFSKGSALAAQGEAWPCEKHLAPVSEKEGVPLGVLYAVGLTESGRKSRLHPYALNIEGETVFAKNRDDALATFSRARKAGKKLIDLGCMQVNHYYHGANFSSPAEMLVPEKNIVYAARFLKQLKQEHGSWTMAVARYHASAGNKKAQKTYICSIIRNLVKTGFGQWTPEAKAFCSARFSLH
jgi:soluble lytic murein transglycosylase-like protein